MKAQIVHDSTEDKSSRVKGKANTVSLLIVWQLQSKPEKQKNTKGGSQVLYK